SRAQLDALLGGQHRRWLVENQHVRPARESSQDFHALLFPNRQRPHGSVGLDLEPELLAETGCAALELRLRNDLGYVGGANRQILSHAELLDEAKMLMDHSHSDRNRIAW